jgi:CBS domain-containing protein
MMEAIAIMGERRISELPITDNEGFPMGMLDITDVVATFPECTEMEPAPNPVLKIVA